MKQDLNEKEAMEDSNYFLKNLRLETFMDHEALPRMGIGNMDYNGLPESKMQVEKLDASTSQRIKDSTSEKQEVVNDDVGQIAAHVQADDFFSSLELQSSSKTSSNVIALNFPNKSTGGIVTRSRSHASALHETNKSTEKKFCHLKTKKLNKHQIKKKKNGKLCLEKKVKSKGRTRKLQCGKKVPPDSKDKICALSDSKKQYSNKLNDNFLEKGLGIEKNKDEDDWVLFGHLNSKKDTEEKMFENKQSLMSDIQNPVRRCTPEFFSINSILMSDTMSEGKDDVDKLLEVDDYDDSFLEEMDDFNYAPPRSHTGGKWKPGSLSIRTSPMLWQSQNWDTLLDDEERKHRVETPVDPLELSGEKVKLPSTSSTGGKLKSCVPPATHTGGKWKPATPPATHTGGKWKPLTPPASFTGGKWKPLETGRPKKCEQDIISPDDTSHNWKCEDEAEPLITHTGGKWKPSPNHSNELWKNESTESVLPPNHTGGKWVSGKGSVSKSTLDVLANCQSTPGKCLKTAGGMIQYYCSPCNRRLSSKKMYKKHIQSELHFKRVLQENELEFDSRSLKLFHGLFTQSNYKERGLGKRVIKKPEIFRDTPSGSSQKGRKISPTVKIRKKRVVRREIIRCEVCKIKMPRYQLGKHLVSYYHSRRIQLNDPEQQKLILDNIHAIVRQAPYQCGICKFYCNTHKLFKKHWGLDIHTEVEKHKSQRFWCALCSFECETSRSMELHLDSNSHREVILAVNKSIPIIIRHKVIFNCRICFKEFRFNRELIHHERIFHKLTEGDTSSKFACSICQQNCKSLKSLQRHILHFHKDPSKLLYFCSSCNEFFNTAEEAKNHRRSQMHKCKTLTGEDNVKKNMSRPCSYCGETIENISKLKIHLFENHSEFLPKCIKCGEVFALSQEVSRHVKNNECSFPQKTSEGSSGSLSCDKCNYCTNLKSEYLLHVAIHEKKPDDKKISCPLCGSNFTQSALGVHLKAHLKEMTYQCSLCSKTFMRKDRYVGHLKSKHCVKEDLKSSDCKELKENTKKLRNPESNDEQAHENKTVEVKTEKCSTRIKKRQVCGDAKCKYVAKDLNDLENHGLFHTAPKTYQCPECPYSAKTSTVIKRHYLIHLDERSFPCNFCSFKARLKSHLKRHMRLHTGAKPFKCPHCSYSCNILENLRKHVLYTKIHPGKKLYECKLCGFDTNVSKEFKIHMSSNHKEDYRPNEANEVAGIYKKEEDLGTLHTPIPVKSRVSTKKRPQMASSAGFGKKAKLLVEKFSPIAPKSAFIDQKLISDCGNLKVVGNSIEDKRKILKMELEKLKSQIKPAQPVKKAPRSYPSPAEKEFKTKMSAEQSGSQVRKNHLKDDAVNAENVCAQISNAENVVLLNVVPTPEEETFSKPAKNNDVTVQQMEFSPAYILYENVLPSEEMELYLLEDYQI